MQTHLSHLSRSQALEEIAVFIVENNLPPSNTVTSSHPTTLNQLENRHGSIMRKAYSWDDAIRVTRHTNRPHTHRSSRTHALLPKRPCFWVKICHPNENVPGGYTILFSNGSENPFVWTLYPDELVEMCGGGSTLSTEYYASRDTPLYTSPDDDDYNDLTKHNRYAAGDVVKTNDGVYYVLANKEAGHYWSAGMYEWRHHYWKRVRQNETFVIGFNDISKKVKAIPHKFGFIFED